MREGVIRDQQLYEEKLREQAAGKQQ